MNKKTLPFREHHLHKLCHFYEESTLPLDNCIHKYFQQNRALGSKDRKELAQALYSAVRWKALLDSQLEKPNWISRIELLKQKSIEELQKQTNTPQDFCSAPSYLFSLVAKQWDEEQAKNFFLICNEQAPTTVRINSTKTSREALLEEWSKDYEVLPTEHSPLGITFLQRPPLFSFPHFHQGLFEVQDEGSQIAANLVETTPGEHVLDFCAGAGGKALAIAPKLKQKGQLYLHDIRAHALQEAKRRLKRAGIQNSQLLFYDDEAKKKRLKKKMDWVFVDAPCSGSGTLRRNPDLKWKISEKMLRDLQGKQRTIFENALSFLRPGGHIIYCTCSILEQENTAQVEHFLAHFPIELVREPWQSSLKPKGMDGFFAATFRRL